MSPLQRRIIELALGDPHGAMHRTRSDLAPAQLGRDPLQEGVTQPGGQSGGQRLLCGICYSAPKICSLPPCAPLRWRVSERCELQRTSWTCSI